MLREIKINNLALIESLHLSFSGHKTSITVPSLAVLTGETGAGKSIILQALNLLSACKASNTWIRTGADTASVEAFFEIKPEKKILLATLHEKGFEVNGTLILKRILSRKGRSRYFINDSMATAALVEFVCENLFSVASQHEHQMLLNPRNHLDFIDSVGELWNKREKFTELFSLWSDLKSEQKKLKLLEHDREQRRDLLAFQLNEIQESNLSDNEDDELFAEKKTLKSSDTLMELGRMSYEMLSDAVSSSIGQVRKNLEQMAQHDETVLEISERITNSRYEIEDLARQIQQYLQEIPRDPLRLEEIETRIDLLQKLKRKYGGSQALLSEVIKYGETAELELNELETMEQSIADIDKKLHSLEEELSAKADFLSQARIKTATQLEKAISKELSTLSFEAADFKVLFNKTNKGLEELSPSGWDHVEFMFSANPGEPVKPLVKIASGGELSRLLLGLKCILARKDDVETVIFDEVDAGIGGQAAEDIALKIKQLADHHQVLCITHLPQIASKADEHFKVTKLLRKNRTSTEISLLDDTARVHELARMLGGDAVTDETVAFAKKLLKKDPITLSPEKLNIK
jgi:DNA repair protein RecN (Recombination protein N)